MYKVVTKRYLNDAKSICLFEVEAPLVARHAKAGQFVIFRLDEQGERVPVSVAGYDREKGTVTVMVQAAGKTTKMLHTVEQGDYISDFVGPLGKATEMEGLNKVCVVGGGVGCAIAYPIAKEMHERGIPSTPMPSNWNHRNRENMEKLKTGKISEVAEVVRNLTRVEFTKHLSTGEKKMLNNAKQILATEFMLSMDITEEKAEEMIAEAI